MQPYVLFKFRPINKYLIDSLVNSELYFSPLKKLNDPHDCRVNLRQALVRANEIAEMKQGPLVHLLRDNEFLEKADRRIQNVGICSFSMKLANTLMWAHYADNHSGVCLCYRFSKQYLNEEMGIIGMSNVVYGAEPLTDWLMTIASGDAKLDAVALQMEVLKKLLTVKGSRWRYEQEARIISPKPGPARLKPEQLLQICFGLETPKEQIQMIRKLVAALGYSVGLAQMRRKNSDFGIEAVGI